MWMVLWKCIYTSCPPVENTPFMLPVSPFLSLSPSFYCVPYLPRTHHSLACAPAFHLSLLYLPFSPPLHSQPLHFLLLSCSLTPLQLHNTPKVPSISKPIIYSMSVLCSDCMASPSVIIPKSKLKFFCGVIRALPLKSTFDFWVCRWQNAFFIFWGYWE